ncbi:pre-mRNA-splicing factor CWC25 homolog [Rhipicephalus sanguineus]|uniref:pre-mRNA-splicing factor CWC25 homolog n=1 Tax=Rhipicephalus sanguineus TaxID=34632 RepID=UPI0018956932|nr:pre-mRNA-splicing factor CWC25 homolog [Rhipicephalus sanguineus]
MGGGDLNLKKSWHPSTLRNIERVWKAEQMRDQEKAKIEQLQKELQEERNKQEMRQYAENKGVVKKREERLDWMYQGVAGLVDREQYLLGRKVDKNFEIMKKEEDGVEDKNEDQQPGSIFTMAPTNAAVDLENKIREDPLFAIKKQEMKTKKTLLSNPVKMKHLKEMIEQSIKSSKKAHKKKKKKEHKKHKRRSPSVSSSGDSTADERDRRDRPSKIDKRDLKIATSSRRGDKEHSVSRHHSDGVSRPKRTSSPHARSHTDKSNTGRDTHLRGQYEKSNSSQRETSHHQPVSTEKRQRRHHSASPDSEDHRELTTQLKRPVKSSSRSHSKRKRHDSSSSEDQKDSKNSQRLHSPVLESNQHDRRPKYGLIVRGNQSHKKEQQPPPLKVQPKEHKQTKTAPQATQRRRPLSEEEKAAARREMMENAQWHDEQRKTIVNQYRKSEAAEEKDRHKDIGEGFIRPMLAKAADTGSVENRIKQKMYTVQRASSAMDVHFARK